MGEYRTRSILQEVAREVVIFWNLAAVPFRDSRPFKGLGVVSVPFSGTCDAIPQTKFLQLVRMA
jgi:hypothetical protein